MREEILSSHNSSQLLGGYEVFLLMRKLETYSRHTTDQKKHLYRERVEHA